MSYAPMAMPTGCQATMMRLIASTLLVSWKLFTPGSRSLSATKQSVMRMSAFCTHLHHQSGVQINSYKYVNKKSDLRR